MKIAVLGAGAAGMMAAVTAAGKGHEVTVYDKNDIPGRKLYITGKGRCNITNDCSTEDLFLSVPRNHEFLYSAFYTFSSQDMIEYLKKGGLKLKTERGRRVFPVSDKSSDVIKFFKNEMDRLGVKTQYKTAIKKINVSGDMVNSLKTEKGDIKADYYIIAAGGGSYPLTGSSGEVLQMLGKIGIDISPFRPSLIPFVLEENVSDLAGLSLKNVALEVKDGKKSLFNETGELLFTHDGISGPLALSASSYTDKFPVDAYIDLKPGMDRQMIEKRILAIFRENPNKTCENALSEMSLSKLSALVVKRSGVERERKVHSVTREERIKITEGFSALKFTVKGTRPLSEAIISRGGVNTDGIDPSSMRIKMFKNLAVAGEIIDIDALTGGYNLQIAFSTGYLAGLNAEIN